MISSGTRLSRSLSTSTHDGCLGATRRMWIVWISRRRKRRYGRLETTKIRPRRIRVVTNLDSAEEPPPQVVERSGAGERTRTADLLITNHQQGRTCRRGRIQLDEFASVYVRRRLTRATGVQPLGGQLGGQRARTCQTLSSHCRPVWTTYELKLKAENTTEVLDCFGPAVDVL